MNDSELLMKLGLRIVIFRKNMKGKKGKPLKQKELAESLGVTSTAMGRLGRGEANPTFLTLNKISKGLKISMKDLVDI